MQQSIVKFYCFVIQTLLNMFRALQCPSSGARQAAVAASGFRMNVDVEVFSAVGGLLTLRLLMSYIYIYGAPILDVSKSHTTTQHSR